MNIDEAVRKHSTFSANHDRLFGESVAQRFFAQVLLIAEWQALVSDEHFTVNGTQIEAWASMKSFVKRTAAARRPRIADAMAPLISREKSAATKRIIH